MNRRIERINALIRNTLGELLLSKLADPRVDPARTSITRVLTTDDLLVAKVYISVIGTEAQQRRTLIALRHAAGHMQELMMREISLRLTPKLDFELDVSFKKTLTTLALISKAMTEIREKEEARAQAAGEQPPPLTQEAEDNDSDAEGLTVEHMDCDPSEAESPQSPDPQGGDKGQAR